MSTTRIVRHTAYLLVTRKGDVRTRRRRPLPHELGVGEYVFELALAVPTVARPAIAGRVEVELPPDVDPEARAAADVVGPLAGPGVDEAAD